MAQPALLRLMADAPPALCSILNPAREAILPPIRSEIFGLQHFADHGRTMRFILLRVSADQALALAAPLCAPLLAQLLLPRQSLPWTTLASQTCFVIPLLREQMVATTPSSSASALRHGSD